MPTHFADRLVLYRWALKQLGIDGFDRLSTLLRSPEFEGWAEDGGSMFVQHLTSHIPRETRSVSDEMLRGYDEN